MSFGFGSEKSSSEGASEASQDVWGGQSPFLQQLYSQAQSLFGQQQGRVPGAANSFAGQGVNATRQGIRSMEDIARTGGPVGQYAKPNNALAQEQLAQASGNIGQNFQRSVMPALNSAAGVAGGMGGSRNALARGVAASDADRQIAQAGTDLYSRQYEIGAQAAGAATQARMGAAAELPGMGSSLYNLGMSPFTAQWAPMTALAGILGGPTVLGKSSSWQKSQGSKMQGSFGLFG